MNRRGLLKTLIGALVLDPERALWVPGAKTISIPMLLTPLTPQQMTAAMLKAFKGTPLFSPSGNAAFLYRTGKIGDIINVRVPPRFIARAGKAYEFESIVEKSVQFVLQEPSK